MGQIRVKRSEINIGNALRHSHEAIAFYVLLRSFKIA